MHKMYVAPLNYDRFFKKVFSDVVVAQAFLQDVLDTPVEIIEKLERQNRVSDRATVVEFNFRCRIGGQNVVVEMQQCYKPSVVKRFYLYHSLQTVLQLDPLYDIAKRKKEQETKIEEIEKKRKLDLDYSNLDPVLTLIWMVHDRLGFEENFMPFVLTPEPVREFLASKLWDTTTNINALQDERKRISGLLENDTKNMHFLAKNRLVFMFQKNIINDIKKYSKNNENILINPTGFQRWFEFAELSLNKENTKDEF